MATADRETMLMAAEVLELWRDDEDEPAFGRAAQRFRAMADQMEDAEAMRIAAEQMGRWTGVAAE